LLSALLIEARQTRVCAASSRTAAAQTISYALTALTQLARRTVQAATVNIALEAVQDPISADRWRRQTETRDTLSALAIGGAVTEAPLCAEWAQLSAAVNITLGTILSAIITAWCLYTQSLLTAP
jgi:hypothetical protein